MIQLISICFSKFYQLLSNLLQFFAKDLEGNPADKVPVTIKVGTRYGSGDILEKKVVVANGEFEINVPLPPFKHNKIYLNGSY